MVTFNRPQFGTVAPERELPKQDSPREACRASGGYWDEKTQTCLSTKPARKPNKLETRPLPGSTQPVSSKDPRSEIPRGVPLTREQSQKLQGLAEFERSKQGGLSAQEAIAVQEIQQQQLAEGQAQAGQIGEFQQLGAQAPGGIGEFDYGEAATVGLRQATLASLGGAAGLAATAFGAAKIGALTGAAAGPAGIAAGAILGGVTGFGVGLMRGMFSNMDSQRRDTTTAQQRVLDEGKQILNDWRTLAEAYPDRRREAISGFNKQLALIDQAHRQMKLDTQGDLLKFETALPNLAEFDAFYSQAGERDFLVQEMRLALTTPSDINMAMLDLAKRRAQQNGND